MAIGIDAGRNIGNINHARLGLLKSFERLSSAQRINRAGDDAAGLAISENLRAAERAFSQGQRNLSDGISLTRTAEGALGETSNNLGRIRELLIQAGNGILGEGERAAIQSEVDQLTAEITRTAESTQFAGRSLLNGETSGAGAVTLRDGSDSVDVVQISIDDTRAAALGVEAIDVNDPASLTSIDAAMRQVSQARGNLGAVENRLQSGIRNLENMRENTAAANSRIRDVDFAQESAENARSQILAQVSIAVQAQANISAALALDLLR